MHTKTDKEYGQVGFSTAKIIEFDKEKVSLYHILIYTQNTQCGSKVDSVLTICLFLGMIELLLRCSVCQSASLALWALTFCSEGEGTAVIVLATVAQGTLTTELSRRSRFTQTGKDLQNRGWTRATGQKSLEACSGLVFEGSALVLLVFMCETGKGPSSHSKRMLNPSIVIIWVSFQRQKCFQLKKTYIQLKKSFFKHVPVLESYNPSSMQTACSFWTLCIGPTLKCIRENMNQE